MFKLKCRLLLLLLYVGIRSASLHFGIKRNEGFEEFVKTLTKITVKRTYISPGPTQISSAFTLAAHGVLMYGVEATVLLQYDGQKYQISHVKVYVY